MWENRYRNYNGIRCLITLDGTDFRIQEPQPFSPKWFSHKFNAAGLRYKLGICIQTGHIVWINGPFAPGKWNGLAIARSNIVHHMEPWEMALADNGYFNCQEKFDTNPSTNALLNYMKETALACHETINQWLK